MVEEGPNPLDNLDLEGLFTDIAKGNFGLGVIQPQQVQEEQSPVGKSLRATFIARCITFILPQRDLRFLKGQHIDIRSIADYFRKESTQWKQVNVQASLAAQKADEAEIIKSLTYTEMAEFAKSRFEEFSKESGSAVPFSDEQKKRQGLADYWGWVEQVTQESADQEKKNPT